MTDFTEEYRRRLREAGVDLNPDGFEEPSDDGACSEPHGSGQCPSCYSPGQDESPERETARQRAQQAGINARTRDLNKKRRSR